MAGRRVVLGLGSPECPPYPYSLQHLRYNSNPQSYELSGKIMVFALLLLSCVLLLFLFLHMYARCLLLRHRRRRFSFLFQHTNNPTASSDADATCGLDASVLASLPVFVFSSETHHTQLECAVCLSDFEEKERGRLLPKCNHSFHIDCIDMWFHSHSTCPLCRAAVLPESPSQPLPLSANRDDQNPESGSGSGSGFCSSCRVDLETGPSSSSLGSGPPSLSGGTSSSFRMKGLEIEVGTKRGESLRDLEGMENGTVSPGEQGLKSPGSRILSLKRIFSGDRRSGAFSTSTNSSVAEADLERGEEQQPRTQS